MTRRPSRGPSAGCAGSCPGWPRRESSGPGAGPSPAPRATRPFSAPAARPAVWKLLLSRTRAPQAATAVPFCIGVVVFAPVAGARWRVEAGAWPYIVGSTAFELVYVLLLSAAYGRARLSVFYPLARGLA